MPLKDVILEIAEEMRKESESLKETGQEGLPTRLVLEMYYRQLQVACKMAADTPVKESIPKEALSSLLESPQAQHSKMVDKFRNEFRKKKNTEAIEENHEGEMVYIKGGPADGNYTNISPEMPLGAYQEIAGAVYQLCRVDPNKPERHLVYDQVQTDHFLKVSGRQPEKPTILLP